MTEILDEERLAGCMRQWRMDIRDAEQRRLAKEWMEYVDKYRYYTTAFFMPYSINGVRGILFLLFLGQAGGDEFRCPGS